jgi:hypothetical protein
MCDEASLAHMAALGGKAKEVGVRIHVDWNSAVTYRLYIPTPEGKDWLTSSMTLPVLEESLDLLTEISKDLRSL